MKTVGINNIIKIILTVLVILFVIYVWPTPYKYIGGGYPYYKCKWGQVLQYNKDYAILAI